MLFIIIILVIFVLYVSTEEDIIEWSNDWLCDKYTNLDDFKVSKVLLESLGLIKLLFIEKLLNLDIKE